MTRISNHRGAFPRISESMGGGKTEKHKFLVLNCRKRLKYLVLKGSKTLGAFGGTKYHLLLYFFFLLHFYGIAEYEKPCCYVAGKIFKQTLFVSPFLAHCTVRSMSNGIKSTRAQVNVKG